MNVRRLHYGIAYMLTEMEKQKEIDKLLAKGKVVDIEPSKPCYLFTSAWDLHQLSLGR